MKTTSRRAANTASDLNDPPTLVQCQFDVEVGVGGGREGAREEVQHGEGEPARARLVL